MAATTAERFPAQPAASTSGRGSGLVFGATPDERRRAYRKARRHTFFVRIMRVLAPLLAVGSLGFYALGDGSLKVAIPGAGTVKVGKVSLLDQVMQNVSYDGYTPDKAYFQVSAEKAQLDGGLGAATVKKDKDGKGIQAGFDVVNLQKLQAKVTQPDKAWFSLTAKGGIMRIKAQSMTLKDGVEARSSAGMTVNLDAADVSFATKKLTSKSAVVITLPQGRVKATGLDLDTQKKHVIFHSKVEAKLAGTGTPPTPAPQPEKGNKAAFDQLGQQSGPVEITASRLEIKDEEKTAVFSGGVKASRTDSTLTGGSMTVLYQAPAPAAGATAAPAKTPEKGKAPAVAAPLDFGSNPADIQRVDVVDAVRLQSADGRSAEADRLIYDRVRGYISLIGSVRVGQGPNVLSGGRIDVDVNGRHTRVSGPGRVKGHFVQEAASGKKPSVKAKSPITPDLNSGSGPVDVEADELDVYDEKGLAFFKGNVVAQRGEQLIKAQELTLSFVAGDAAGATPGAGSKLKRMEARKKVSVKAPNGQFVTGDRMIYEAGANVLTVVGNVVVTRGKDVVNGDKLLVDIDSGEIRFVSDEAPKSKTADGEAAPVKKKRVRVMFTQDGMKALEEEQAGAGQQGSANTPQRQKKAAPVTPEP